MWSCINEKHSSNLIQVFFFVAWIGMLSHTGGGGGKAVQGSLSCPTHMGIKESILLIILMLNHLKVEMYQL